MVRIVVLALILVPLALGACSDSEAVPPDSEVRSLKFEIITDDATRPGTWAVLSPQVSLDSMVFQNLDWLYGCAECEGYPMQYCELDSDGNIDWSRCHFECRGMMFDCPIAVGRGPKAN